MATIDSKRDSLIVALNRAGIVGAVRDKYFDGLWKEGGDGGEHEPENRNQYFGVFYYDNSQVQQNIPGGIWTTLSNDGKGAGTSREFSPTDIEDILELPSGRIMTERLKLGDEVYVRHTVNIIATVAGTNFAFRHLIGTDVDGFKLPSTQQMILGSAGSSTGDFIVDAHFFMQENGRRMIGAFPQIFSSNPVTMKHTASYISIVRS